MREIFRREIRREKMAQNALLYTTHVLVFNIRHVFKKGNKCSPLIFLADCLYDNV